MTLDKFALVYDTAVRKVSARYGVAVPSHHQLGLLVLLKRKGSTRLGIACSWFDRYGKSADGSYVSNSFTYLLDQGFATKDGHVYTITSLGREYLSALRNYLRNYRL